MTLLMGIIAGVALALIVNEVADWLAGHYPPDRPRRWHDSSRDDSGRGRERR